MMLCLLLLSLTLILSACGGDDKNAAKNEDADKEDQTEEQSTEPKIGLNKITLDEMVKKKNSKESFFLFMFKAPKKQVKNTKLLEAYDKALKEKKVKAFYINIHDFGYKKNQKLKKLDETYKKRISGHNPFEDGGIVVVHHGKIDSAFAYLGKFKSTNMEIYELNKSNKTFLKNSVYKDIKKDIQHNLDYVKEIKINM